MSEKTVQMKLDEGRQYRDIVSFEVRAASDENDDKRTVEGYATVFNTPYTLFRDGKNVIMEQVDANAFDGTDMSDVIMQYDHSGRVFARTKNGTLRLAPDDNGLRIEADLGGTELGRQLYDEIAGGYTDKMSFGFRVGKDKRETVTDANTGDVIITRTILSFGKLYDVSAVSLPANDATSISVRSFCDGVVAEIEAERLALEARERQKRKIKLMLEV